MLRGQRQPPSPSPRTVISSLGSPSLEDYGLRETASNGGCVEMQDTGKLWNVKHTHTHTRVGKPAALTQAALNAATSADEGAHTHTHIRARAWLGVLAAGGLAPRDLVGSRRARWRSGLVHLRERAQGVMNLWSRHTHTHTHNQM